MLSLGCLLIPELSQARADADRILDSVYGSISTACTQDLDADNGESNVLAMAAGKRWLVYCHDEAGAGVACECLQGISTVDASAAVGITLFAGEKMIVMQRTGNTHISCEPFANAAYDICPLD